MAERTITIRKIGHSLGIIFKSGVCEVYDFHEGDVLEVSYEIPKIILKKKELANERH